MDWQQQFEIWKERFLVPLDDPGSRLFHLNIAVALVLGLFWLFRTDGRVTWGQTKLLFFRKKYWWNRSTRTDYKLYIFNSLLKVFLLIPFLDISFQISRAVSEGLISFNGDFAGLTPDSASLFVFTVGAFIWDDFLRFGQHLLMHQIPVLWKIHSVHHSARILTPITLFRNHPLESAIATVRNSLSLGVATGLFIFLFQAQLNVVTFFGVNMLGFLFNLLGANLRHSHIPLRFPRWVEHVFISPFQHQMHHSLAPAHLDRNFGVSLAIWDKLCGKLVCSESVPTRTPLKFGILKESRF
ncbi:MAG: sterol desaturase family protein [Bdellovibrionales bacterium]|nr:sterol desaturase family protein [Bdellovibrionales bacterium]